nr:uncharacterized protein LOC129453464 isoform X2 [Misgurnus anguillicaudatus]
MKGDPVTINIDVPDPETYYKILLIFGCDDTIAQVNNQNKKFTLDGKGRDGLKLNDQTGDLTITDIRTEDGGHYELKMSSSRRTIQRRFSVNVSERGLSPGAIAGISVFLILLAAAAAAAGVIFYRRKIAELLVLKVDEGKSVDLKTEVTDIQRDEKIEWRFRDEYGEDDEEFLIAEINPANNMFSTYDGDKGRFRDKLKLNHQTGDLNINNFRKKHTGEYILKITRDGKTTYRRFRVSVRDDLALRGRAVQSSTAYGWVASNAIDNSPFTCTHTDTSDNPWWRLDLLDSYYISRVVITNRKDCCAERLNGAEIRIGNSLENNGNNNPRYAVLNGVAAGQSVSVSCHNTNGRYVNVIIPGSSKILSLAKVEVYQAEDLALRGRAVQSSTGYGWEASNAIENLPLTCTHTDTSDNPWWRLDLLDSYYISTVVITNRKDCCAERLNGAEIRIGNSLENNGNNNPRYAVLNGVPAGQSVSVSCHNTNGRYVNIIIPGHSKILSLAKVEVYQAEDLALRGRAVQSSTGYGWEASNAIDNLPFTCTHTDTSDNPWWRLDLLDSYYISTVVITNRKDCCAERLNGAEIRIGNSLENNGNNNPRYAVLNGVPAGQSVSVSCHNTNGRYVNVIIPGSSKILSLAKVEVYQAEDLALRGRAVQSSTGYGWEASNAIDNLPFTCTHTDTSDNPWWRLDLLDSYNISTVVITNRKDCCAERLNGAEIRIGNSLENNGNNNPRYAVLNGVAAGQSVSVSCHNTNGRYVNVIIPGHSKILSLAKVAVSQAEDLALRGRAVQSSTAYGWEASNAIDNLPLTCTHTDTSDNPWWRLDLLDSYYISTVVITNRKDCCEERLNGAEIRIGNSLENNGNNNPRYAVLNGVAAGQSVSVSCHNMNGRYVNVIIPGSSKILSLAQVEVYKAASKREDPVEAREDLVEIRGGDSVRIEMQPLLNNSSQ